MPCYGPLTAYYPAADSNDRRLVFDKRKSNTGVSIKVPCGKCSGCKLEHSRQWAVRCMHEKRLHNASAFITLTINDKNLTPNHSLVKADLQKFMKRLNKHMGGGQRFFACGEYGEKTNRPHYHVLILNYDFSDKKLHKKGADYNLYTSPSLDKLWSLGFAVLGDVTFESAAYVARYCMKKITGPHSRFHYGTRQKEFIVMSRRPGLGTGYYDKFNAELIAHDTIIVNGHPAALPRFYDNKYAVQTAETDKIGLYTVAELVKLKRRRKITRAMRDDTTSRRLRVREVVQLAKLKQKARIL